MIHGLALFCVLATTSLLAMPRHHDDESPVDAAVTSDGRQDLTEAAATKLARLVDSALSSEIGLNPTVARPQLQLPDAAPFFWGQWQKQAPEGIAGYPVVFHSGHGLVKMFKVRKNKDVLSRRLTLGVGDLRYFWMLSCLVLAHGPARDGRFSCPGEFGAVSSCTDGVSENAFLRWGVSQVKDPALGPRLRLLCGGSTTIELNVEKLWTNLVAREYGLADSYVLALSRDSDYPEVAACMTSGSSDHQGTALYDRRFTSTENVRAEEATSLFYQYPKFETARASRRSMHPLDATASLPVLELAPGLPEGLLDAWLPDGRGLAAFRKSEAGFLEYEHDGLRLKVYPQSGSLHVIAESSVRQTETAIKATGATAAFVEAYSPTGRVRQPSSATELWIQRVARVEGGLGRDVWNGLKSREESHRYNVKVPGLVEPLPVIGDGGRVTVLRSADRGEPFNLAFLARPVERVVPGSGLSPMSVESALDKAVRVLRQKGLEEYARVESLWGYLEAPALCRQRQMGVVYRFRFEFEDPGVPIAVVDIPLHEVAPWECPWSEDDASQR